MNLSAKFKDHPLLLFPDFRNFFIGDILVAIAERFFAITFAWWIISQEGENGKWLGVLMAVEAIPILCLSPFVGPLIDRYNKKICMLLGVFMQLFFVSLIAYLMAFGRLEFLYLVILSFCMSCFVPQFEDAVSASVAKLVDEEHLSGATTIQASTIEFSNIIAAVLSTSIIAAAGILSAVYVNIALYVVGILFLLSIKADLSPEQTDDEEEEEGYLQELKKGLLYVWEFKALRWYALIYALETFLIVPIFILIPMLVRYVLAESVNWVAVFETSLSAGAVLMTLLMSFKQRYRNYYPTYAVGLALIGLAMAGLAVMENEYLMTALIFVIGMAFAALMSFSFMLFQHTVPQELKGRFFGLMSTIAAGMSPLSYLFVGTTADYASVNVVFMICGVGALLLAGIVLFVPRVRRHIGYDDEGHEVELPEED